MSPKTRKFLAKVEAYDFSQKDKPVFMRYGGYNSSLSEQFIHSINMCYDCNIVQAIEEGIEIDKQEFITIVTALFPYYSLEDAAKIWAYAKKQD
jgi:hypothetical protein